MGVDDFNADGGPDLVWQNRATGQIRSLFTPSQVMDSKLETHSGLELGDRTHPDDGD